MIFTLEVLEAKHGDCLLLHFGDNNNPNTIVIDGGPPGVYVDRLKPRLLAIKERLSPDKAMALSMVMVSHLDDDHVNGILQLADDVDESGEFVLNDLWVNTFDDIIGNLQIPRISALDASAKTANTSNFPSSVDADRFTMAVIASTSQGRQLRNIANKLRCTVNSPFSKFNGTTLVRGDVKQNPIDWKHTGLKIHVVHPSEARLNKLQKQWDKDLKTMKNNGDDSIIMASLTGLDSSAFNLSSIVCLVEFGGKKILLTGDGRSDDIYDGLIENNRLDAQGKLHVDILKMPHHGSIRNMKREFLQNVTADHYVISADGNFDNPDRELLALFTEVVTKGTLHLTNHDGKKQLRQKLDEFINDLQNANSPLKVSFLEDKSILINLIDPTDF